MPEIQLYLSIQQQGPVTDDSLITEPRTNLSFFKGMLYVKRSYKRFVISNYHPCISEQSVLTFNDLLQVRDSINFSVIADGTIDTSLIDQMSIVFRYHHAGTTKEAFIEFVTVTGATRG